MSKAFRAFTKLKSDNKIRDFNSRLFESYRISCNFTHNEYTCRKISESAKLRVGDKNPFYGRVHSDESKIKMSNKRKEYLSTHEGSFKGKHWSESDRKRISSQHLGVKLSEDHRKRISDGCKKVKDKLSANKNRTWCNNGSIQIFLKPNELIPDGFIKGQLPMSLKNKLKCKEAAKSRNYIKKNNGSLGMHWYNNGVYNKLFYECPENFIVGRLHKA